MYLNDHDYISFFDAGFYGNKIFLCNNLYNGLFKYDLKSDTTEWIGRFNDELIDSLLLCRKVAADEKNIFFFPGNADSIAVYNISSKSIKSIKLKKRIADKRTLKNIGYIRRDSRMYLIPALTINPLVEFDMSTIEIKETDRWMDVFFNNLLIDNNIEFERISLMTDMGDVFLFHLDNSNYWIRKDMIEDSSEILSLDIPSQSIMCTVGLDKTSYCIIRGTSDLYCYLDSDRKMRKINYSIKGRKDNKYDWQMIINCNERIFLLDIKETAIFEYNSLSEEIVLFTELEEDNIEFKDRRSLWPDYWGARIHDNKLYLFPYGSSRISEVDLLDGSVKYHSVSFSNDEIYRINMKSRFETGQITIENSDKAIECFIEYLKSI